MQWIKALPFTSILIPRSMTKGLGFVYAILFAGFSSLSIFPVYQLNYDRVVQAEINKITFFWFHTIFEKAPDSANQQEYDRLFLKNQGKDFVRRKIIKGGAIFDKHGEAQAIFGNKPSLSVDEARADNIERFLHHDQAYLDVHIASQATNLPYDMIVTFDNKNFIEKAKHETQRSMLIIFGFFGIVALFMYASVYFYIVLPLRKIITRKYIVAASSKQWRHDEIALLAERLMSSTMALTHLNNDNLTLFMRQNEIQSLPCLGYDKNGYLTYLNRAAMQFFTISSLEEAQQLPRDFMLVPSSMDGKKYRQNVLGLLAQGNRLCECEISHQGQTIGCLIDGVVLNDSQSSPCYYSLTIVTLDTVASRLRILTDKNTALLKDISLFDVKQMELKQLLESCLCLLSGAKPSEKGDEDFEDAILPDRIINEWYEDARKAKLVSGRLEHSLLPVLKGSRDNVRDIFRQGLLLVYARTSIDRPTLAIDTSIEGNMAIFKVHDISDHRAGGGAGRVKNVDWNLPYAALLKALQRNQGRLIQLGPEKETAFVRFALPASQTQDIEIDLIKARA
jgi:hypothetical protein